MTKLAALIVETRNIPNLVEIIQSHMSFLPENTDLIIYCSAQNHSILAEAFPSSMRHVIEKMDEMEFNRLLTTPSFWESLLQWDRILFFQHDSMIIRKGVEEFYEWDYVGSAWPWQEWGGNGGFSLRNPAVMKNICQKYVWDITMGNCDVFYSNLLYKYPEYGKLAPREVCMKWGTESVFALGTLGYHAIDKWLSKEQVSQVIGQYNISVNQ